jgi:SSS family solute:Na+ symporter
MTDAELMELRYSGKAASTLRVVSAVYNGLIKNCVVMGWVMLAMVKFANVLLGWDALLTLGVCVSLAVVYTSASGIWGVVATDLFQFITGLLGSIILAGIVMNVVGGPSGLTEQIKGLSDAPVGALDILPNPRNISSLEFASYLCLILVLWSRSGHDGYSGQRLFATKNDKHAVLAAFLWGFLGITVMTWPWIIVGLGSLIVFPISEASEALAADPELAYLMMLAELMPVGLKGLLVASFLAAFMSTMDTHLCWGGSYLVNDIYKRFIKKNAKQSEYVWASRISILVLAGFAAITAYYMDSIEKAWIYIIDLTAGMAVIWALRWYWWRVNAWAEITAMICSLLLANGGFILLGLNGIGLMSEGTFHSLNVVYTDDFNMIRAVIILIVTTFVWILVSYFSKPTDKKVLTDFYRLVQPSGWWGEIAKENPDIKSEVTASFRWTGWLLGVVFIYCSLLGIGYLVTAHYLLGFAMIIISILSLYFLIKKFEINASRL